jgi:hypothetical protein
MWYPGIIVALAGVAVLAGTALSAWPPTPRPSERSQMSPTDLRYRLIDVFGEPFYCDPDMYPVASGVLPAEVHRRVLDLRTSNSEMFRGITAYLGIADPTVLTDEQVSQIYGEFKRLAAVQLEPVDGGYRFLMRVRDGARQGRQLSGLITTAGDIGNVGSEPTFLTCPICLAGDAGIDSPQGIVPVKDLRKGMVVWTADSRGMRQPAVIVETIERRVPIEHDMIHLVLSDDRELHVAAGHPTAQGKPIGSLAHGELVDGARVIKLDLVRYREAATYDILPSGETGTYWANGILLGSTLAAYPVQR